MDLQFRLICQLSLVLIIFHSHVTATDITRKLIPAKDPCDDQGVTKYLGILYHIVAESESDAIHYIYSSYGSFAIFTALAPLNTNLTINCKNFFSGNDTLSASSIHFSKLLNYKYVALFTNLFESNATSERKISFANLVWAPANVTYDTHNNEINLVYANANSSSFQENSIQLELTVTSKTRRSSVMPRLVYTSNSTQINFILNKTTAEYPNSRFGVEMYGIGLAPDTNFSLSYSSSLDDEFTPGVFKLIQMQSGYCQEKMPGAYAQWKPIVYTTQSHGRESSGQTAESELEYQDLKSFPVEAVTKSLAYAVFNGDFTNNFGQKLNVTFGQDGDDYYTKTNYSSWTLGIGYGIPPEDTVSPLVIAVLAVGLGVPFLLLMGGGAYVLVKRYRTRKDDLLLNE